MADPWNGYAAVNDDVRHAYERVFYGRQLTGDAMQDDVAGMARAPGQAAPAAEAGTVWGKPEEAAPSAAQSLYGTDASHEERQAAAEAWKHAENAPGIRREMEEEDGRRYTHTNAPDLVARGEDSRAAMALYGGPQPSVEPDRASRAADLYGPAPSAQGPEGGNVWGPTQEAAPSAAPAAPSNDMTPG